MRARLFFLLALLPSAVLADPPQNTIFVTTKPPPPESASSHIPAGAPVAVGRPHLCAQYPEAAVKNHVEGTTVLAFRVGTDGAVKNITIAKSSGDPDLDAASITCAAEWRYTPGRENGAASEMPWQAAVQWKIGSPEDLARMTTPLAPPFPPGLVPPKSAGPRAACSKRTPISARPSPETTVMQFTITIEGRVQDVAVKQSSGSAALDKAATDCVATWRYMPARNDGNPQAVIWTAQVNWQVR